MSRPLQLLQENLLLWFYTAFVHRLGTYLIDLNSGRLRVGAQRYRELLAAGIPAAHAGRPGNAAADIAARQRAQVRQVTLTLMGQVKAGKSSLINALLGEQRARTDVLPATDRITRYELQPPGMPSRLVLLDTVGYGHSGRGRIRCAPPRRRPASRTCCCWWCTPATRPPGRPGHAAEAAGLVRLPAGAEDAAGPGRDDPHRPVVPGDGMESRPTTGRSRSGPRSSRSRRPGTPSASSSAITWSASSRCVPRRERFTAWRNGSCRRVAELLDEAHAVAMLRCLRAEADAGKVRKVLQQLLLAGKEAARALWQAPGWPGASNAG